MARKIHELSIDEQKELLVCYDGANLQYISRHRAAQMLNVSRSALRTLLGNRKAIESRRDSSGSSSSGTGGHRTTATDDNSRRRSLTLDDVEKCLFRFFVQMINLNMPVTNDILLGKAKVIAAQFGLNNFIPTRTWLIYWKYKNNIPFEPTAADHETDFNRLANDKWLKDLVQYAASAYRGDDVYGLVETRLYFPPAAADGEKQRVQRLSALFLCNLTGTDKKRPVVIENDFRHVRFNALLTNHYASFLKKWSQELGGSKKILLVLDNRSAHPTVELQNIEIKYLPKSVVHPLGQSIVRVAKTYENLNVMTAAAAAAAGGGPTTGASWDYTVSEYVNTLLNTWERMSSASIRDCYRAIGFVVPPLPAKIENLLVDRPGQQPPPPPQQQRSSVVAVTGHSTFNADGPSPRVSREEQNLPLNLCKKDDVVRSRKRKTDDDDDWCNIPTTVTVAAAAASPHQ